MSDFSSDFSNEKKNTCKIRRVGGVNSALCSRLVLCGANSCGSFLICRETSSLSFLIVKEKRKIQKELKELQVDVLSKM